MKNILLIGVGGTGSNAVEILDQKIKELGKQNDNNISAIVFDTDIGDIKKIESATPIPMADIASVGTICDRLGRENLKEWFPCDDKSIRAQEMIRGASQWRKKSYLAFLNLMNKPASRAAFVGTLEKLVLNPGSAVEVYVIASVAGGTGSGSFIPIALYAKRYLRKNLGKDPIVNALIALPDIYAESQTPENKVKVFANAYAILRELNAINLVARNYNAGRTDRKKAPIRFKIGSKSDPNVGVLFDSMDESFWTPEAAPFSQIFVLDKIPGVNSIAAHDIVLANSLYAIICTDIGAAFDSEMSNHELIHSQNNGSNAIYASISTSQICFPKNSVLNYLAHRKALEACKDEWLIIHNAVERRIAENDKLEREAGRRYTLKDGDYARLVLDELKAQEQSGSSKVVDIIERGTAKYEGGKKSNKNTAEVFYDELVESIQKVIPESSQIWESLVNNDINKFIPQKAGEKDKIKSLSNALYVKIAKYFTECIEVIKRMRTSLGDGIFTLDKTKFNVEDSLDKTLMKEFTLIKNLFISPINKDKCIHPVAAMVQLCRLKAKISDEIGGFTENDIWPEFKQKNLQIKIPEGFISEACANVQALSKSKYINVKKCAYLKYTKNARFRSLQGNKEYDATAGDARVDYTYILGDANKLISIIEKHARDLIRNIVLKRLSDEVDILIDKYRIFFTRFNKEKEDLIEETNTALRKDSTQNGSVINVYSSETDKQKIYDYIMKTTGPESEAELIESDDIVGRGVLNTVYNSASAFYLASTSSNKSGVEWNDKDSGAYQSLFANMVLSYSKYISNGEAYKMLAEYNVIEAIEATCPYGAGIEQKLKVYKEKFQAMLDLAVPPLKVNNSSNVGDLVTSSDIIVVMVSINTAKYILKHADEFGIKVSSENTKQDKILKSCAESFIKLVSGNNSVRVTIVDMPDYQLYCTGEKVDITPLRIAKFDEMGEDNTYFQNYEDAIRRSIRYNTDMWNPHIGKDLYKRGYLPYMNEKTEKVYDVRMVKALIYALGKGEVFYKNGATARSKEYHFRCLHYNGQFIRANDGTLITKKNIALLVDWIRNEDDLIMDWSEKFDSFIKEQKESLPNTVNESEDDVLKRTLTNSEFIMWLRDGLFLDESLPGDNKKLTLLEFAYLIKTSEESMRDNDDAERVLEVAYEVFLDLIRCKANDEVNAERFINLYRHELERVFFGLANSATICKSNVDSSSTFTQIVNWINDAGYFKDISVKTPIDTKGAVRITEHFDYLNHEVTAIKNALMSSDASKTNKEEKVTESVAAKVETDGAIVDEATPKTEAKKATTKKTTRTYTKRGTSKSGSKTNK